MFDNNYIAIEDTAFLVTRVDANAIHIVFTAIAKP